MRKKNLKAFSFSEGLVNFSIVENLDFLTSLFPPRERSFFSTNFRKLIKNAETSKNRWNFQKLYELPKVIKISNGPIGFFGFFKEFLNFFCYDFLVFVISILKKQLKKTQAIVVSKGTVTLFDNFCISNVTLPSVVVCFLTPCFRS